MKEKRRGRAWPVLGLCLVLLAPRAAVGQGGGLRVGAAHIDITRRASPRPPSGTGRTSAPSSSTTAPRELGAPVENVVLPPVWAGG